MRALSMLRVLLPSWRFFDDSAGSPHLLLRTASSEADFGPWRELVFAPRSAPHAPTAPGASTALARVRGVHPLLLHPRGGLALAHYSLVEHLLDELAELDPDGLTDVTRLVSYRLVLRLVERHLGASAEPGHPLRFQFKLSLFAERADDRAGPEDGALARGDAPLDAGEDLLVSSIHVSPLARVSS